MWRVVCGWLDGYIEGNLSKGESVPLTIAGAFICQSGALIFVNHGGGRWLLGGLGTFCCLFHKRGYILSFVRPLSFCRPGCLIFLDVVDAFILLTGGVRFVRVFLFYVCVNASGVVVLSSRQVYLILCCFHYRCGKDCATGKCY